MVPSKSTAISIFFLLGIIEGKEGKGGKGNTFTISILVCRGGKGGRVFTFFTSLLLYLLYYFTFFTTLLLYYSLILYVETEGPTASAAVFYGTGITDGFIIFGALPEVEHVVFDIVYLIGA